MTAIPQIVSLISRFISPQCIFQMNSMMNLSETLISLHLIHFSGFHHLQDSLTSSAQQTNHCHRVPFSLSTTSPAGHSLLHPHYLAILTQQEFPKYFMKFYALQPCAHDFSAYNAFFPHPTSNLQLTDLLNYSFFKYQIKLYFPSVF